MDRLRSMAVFAEASGGGSGLGGDEAAVLSSPGRPQRRRLCRVLTEAELEPIPVHLVHPEGRHTSAKVRAFLDFAASRLRERLRVLADQLEADESLRPS